MTFADNIPAPTPTGPIDTGDVGDLTDVQSYTYILVDWVFQALRDDPYFVNFALARMVNALPIDSWSQVPFLGVFLGEEQLAPEGSINMTDIRFTHSVPVNFQIILRHNDPDTLLKYLDQTSWYLMRRLLRDDKLTNRLLSALPGNTRVEGFPRGRIRERWGLTGSANETPIGERLLSLTFLFKTNWEPYGFANLDQIVVTTGFPGPGSTPEEQAQIQQVRMVYNFSQPKGAADARASQAGNGQARAINPNEAA